MIQKMCIIVDINVAHRVFRKVPDHDFGPITNALFRTSPGLTARLVYGGRLRTEYESSRTTADAIRALDQRGRAIRLPDDQVNAKEDTIRKTATLTSDDPHVLAVALIAGARLLCTLDAALIADFTNPRLIPGRGRVYQNATHAHLLRTHCRRRAR